jgi:hypothetical protein
MPQDENIKPSRLAFVGSRSTVVTPAPSAGASDFLSLDDTPSSYSGEGEKRVRVNAAEDALEFFTPEPALDLSTQQVIVLTTADFNIWTDGSTGSGSAVTSGSLRTRCASGTTAGSMGQINSLLPFRGSSSGPLGLIDFDNENLDLTIIVVDDFSGGGSPQRFGRFKLATSTGRGTLGGVGLAVEYDRNSVNINLQSHDGTAIQTTTVAKSTSNVIDRIRIIHTGGTDVKFYLNGALAATHTTRVPTGSQTPRAMFEADNAAGTTNVNFDAVGLIVVKAWV